MKQRHLTRLLALLIAVLIAVAVLPAQPAMAMVSEGEWSGGDPDHDHATKSEELINTGDPETHMHMYACECGASKSVTEPHQFSETPISPGNPDGSFPNGGTHYECACGYSYDKENPSSETPTDQDGWTGGNSDPSHVHAAQGEPVYTKIDDQKHSVTVSCECGATKTTEEEHQIKKSSITAGSTGFPYGGTIIYCEKNCGYGVEKANPKPKPKTTKTGTTAKPSPSPEAVEEESAPPEETPAEEAKPAEETTPPEETAVTTQTSPAPESSGEQVTEVTTPSGKTYKIKVIENNKRSGCC